MIGCAGVLADIGTDHAYLPVWLLHNKIISKAIACDIAEGPCGAARANIAAFGMQDCIEVRMGNGLEQIVPGEAEVIVIAGMGAATIIDILSGAPETAGAAQRIFLQPMAGAPGLRKWLYENGYIIEDEELVKDGKFLYEIMAAQPGEAKKISETEAFIGPALLQKRHPLLEEHFTRRIHGLKRELANMSLSESAGKSDTYAKKKDLLEELEVLAREHNCQ